jgi:hypothetical protein
MLKTTTENIYYKHFYEINNSAMLMTKSATEFKTNSAHQFDYLKSAQL